jgi:hypothetical protein
MYRQHGQLLQWSGIPNRTYNNSGTYGWRIIFPVNKPAGSDQKIVIGVDIWCWDEPGGSVGTVIWDGAPGLQQTLPYLDTLATQTLDEIPQGPRFFTKNEVAYNYNETNGYGFVHVRTPNMTPAFVSAFTVPRNTVDFQGDTADTVSGNTIFDQEFNVKNDAFNPGSALRGTYEVNESTPIGKYYSTDGSVGALSQHQNARTARSSMVGSSKKCLFQWGHPGGLYVTAGASPVDIFGAPTVSGSARPVKIKVEGSDLIGSDRSLDLVLTGRWDSGSSITLTSDNASSGGTGTFNLVGSVTGVTPSMAVDIGTINFDPSGDEIRIQYDNTTSGDAIEIHSIALFESSSTV